MAGARWVQKEILDQYPEDDLRVYAVWFDMLLGDDRSQWPADVFTDSRVQEFWDEDRIIGRWFAKNEPEHSLGPITWDAYFLYGPQAQWETIPGPLIDFGRTIIADRNSLKAEVVKLIASGRASP